MATTEEPLPKHLEDYEWMVRPCNLYKDEYSNCTSIKARFHQYFIYGETLDCTAWKHDHTNCLKWEDNKNIKSLSELIDSEKRRRDARMAPHLANNIWQKRDKPPPDWNKPLPEEMQKEYEHTYLALKAKELREGRDDKASILDKRSFCVVS